MEENMNKKEQDTTHYQEALVDINSKPKANKAVIITGTKVARFIFLVSSLLIAFFLILEIGTKTSDNIAIYASLLASQILLFMCYSKNRNKT